MGFVGDALIEIVMSLISVVFGWIMKPFLDLSTFEDLIFGTNGSEDLVFGVFTVDEIQKIYSPGVYTFATLAAFALIIGIVLAGTKISSVGINPSNRTYIIMFGLDLLVVAILLSNLSTIYSLIFDVNQTILKVFDFRPEESTFKMSATLPENDEGILGKFIINLMVLGLTLWANWYYTMRKITLMIFLIMGPLMVVFYMVPRLKPITMSWFKEFTGTVFIQSIHAMVYWMAALMTQTEDLIESVILYMLFIPLGEMVRSLLRLGGGMNGKLSSAGAMFGMSAIAGMYGAVKGAMGDKTVAGAVREAYQGIKGTKNSNTTDEDGSTSKVVGANTGTDTGTTSLAEKMLKPGEIGSKMGKAVAGIAGSIAGSPMGVGGSMALAHLGAEVGDKIGGLTGRAGAASIQGVSKQLRKGISDGIKTGKNILNASEGNDEKLAKELAEAETNQWASRNREQFYKDMQGRFPDLDQESLDKMWNDTLDEKRGHFYKDAKEMVSNIRKNDGQFAKASSLANASADKFTQDWAKANKQEFMEEYDRQNPIHPNMTKEQIKDHEKNREAAWNDAVSQKREQYQNIANQTAKELSHGMSPESSYIHKGDFAEKMAGKVLDLDKQAYVSQQKNRLPQMSEKEIEVEYMNKHGDKQKQYVEMAANAVNSVSATNAHDLIDQTSDNLTNQWAKQHKGNFKKNYIKQNPNATEQDVEVAWNNAVAEKKKEFLSISENAAQNITNGKELSNVQIDQKDFAGQIGKQLFHNDKQAYIQNVRQNGTTDNAQLEVEFEEKFGGNKVYLQKAKRAVNNVNGGHVFSGALANHDLLANQIAYVKTQEAKQSFLQANQGNEQAEVLWSQQEGTEFTKNLKSVRKTLPKHIPSNNIQIPNNVLRGATAVGAGIVSGAISASGIKEVTSALKSVPVVDTGIRMVKDGALAGTTAFQTTLKDSNAFLPVRVIKGAKDFVKEGSHHSLKAYSTPTVVENPLEKQESFRNGVAYIGGVLGGVSGYQKAARLATKYNMFNQAANEQIAEVSQIEHMAQKVDVGNGEMAIANGAVQLVTTNNRSYVQVRDKAGQTRIVSRYGTGDSSLKNGEIVYQDLNIQDGALVQSSSPYQLDSGGGKVNLNRQLNINPSKLLINRNTPTSPVKFDQLQPYNQQVDSGQFYANDIIQTTSNIRMRITHNRSYLVAEDSSGQEVRVSPYGKGDPRIAKDSVEEIHCTIRNNRIVKDKVKNIEVNQTTFNTSLEPQDLVPPKTNKRLAQRRAFENSRHRTLGGTV